MLGPGDDVQLLLRFALRNAVGFGAANTVNELALRSIGSRSLADRVGGPVSARRG